MPLAPVMLPNDDVLIVADGLLKFAWLNSAKVSKRNWNFNRSLIGKFLKSEKFTVSAPGPCNRLRPALPYAIIGRCDRVQIRDGEGGRIDASHQVPAAAVAVAA